MIISQRFYTVNGMIMRTDASQVGSQNDAQTVGDASNINTLRKLTYFISNKFKSVHSFHHYNTVILSVS